MTKTIRDSIFTFGFHLFTQFSPPTLAGKISIYNATIHNKQHKITT